MAIISPNWESVCLSCEPASLRAVVREPPQTEHGAAYCAAGSARCQANKRSSGAGLSVSRVELTALT